MQHFCTGTPYLCTEITICCTKTIFKSMEKVGIRNKLEWFLTELVTDDSENSEVELADEQEDQQLTHEKEERRKVLEQDLSYRMVKWIATAMDKWFIDPIIGFLAPGLGDIFTSVMTVPFIYVALCRVKSVPLTLAIIYNTLMDVLIGIIPLLGDVFDFFNRSYKQNYAMIVGFVEGDKRITRVVNGKAVQFLILIVMICFIIYCLVGWIITAWQYVLSLLA